MGADVEAAVVRAVAPAVAAHGCCVYDVEVTGAGRSRTVRVFVDRDGGVDLDTVTAVTQGVSDALDACAALGGPYLLEVSSPGLERRLRRPEHYRAAIGETVSVTFHTDAGPRRVRGVLVAADDERAVVEADGDRTEVAYAAVTKARTVFEWGPAPRPGARARAQERTAKR
ncbi:MAG: ribosome maturation factor [Acidimicrobiia bacterium]|nr:MAG: ribosome maturation factor [Acidimicrobiia bacterium]